MNDRSNTWSIRYIVATSVRWGMNGEPLSMILLKEAVNIEKLYTCSSIPPQNCMISYTLPRPAPWWAVARSSIADQSGCIVKNEINTCTTCRVITTTWHCASLLHMSLPSGTAVKPKIEILKLAQIVRDTWFNIDFHWILDKRLFCNDNVTNWSFLIWCRYIHFWALTSYIHVLNGVYSSETLSQFWVAVLILNTAIN